MAASERNDWDCGYEEAFPGTAARVLFGGAQPMCPHDLLVIILLGERRYPGNKPRRTNTHTPRSSRLPPVASYVTKKHLSMCRGINNYRDFFMRTALGVVSGQRSSNLWNSTRGLRLDTWSMIKPTARNRV